MSPTLSPGSGNASDLFPTVGPKPTTSHSQPAPKEHTTPVADTSALPEGATVIGAQVAGLIALALAFVLAVTRMSLRRRPTASTGEPVASPPPEEGPAPDDEPPPAAADNEEEDK